MSVILILAVVLLLALQKFWAPYALASLRFKGSCDHILAEPGETVTWTATVENHSRLPVPFIRLVENFPNQTQVAADPKWQERHCKMGIQSWSVEEKLSLLPLQSVEKSVRFTCARRGAYRVGSYRLAAGDLLGFREELVQGDGLNVVVMPRKSEDQAALAALGGFLGDISVRRFILEDPVLTVGFRDYTGREPLKAVSWTRTATAGKLQVKQFDHTAEQNVMVLLNVSGASPEALEECFRLTRMACEQLERKKIPFSFRTNGNLPGPTGKIFFQPEGLGASHLNAILYGLGQADGTCYISFPTLVRQTLRRRKNNESYILITPALAGTDADAVHTLEQAASNPVCVLTGKEERP